MNTVEPIRDINTVMDIADYLKSKNERDYVMFMFGIYTGLRISDMLNFIWRVIVEKNKERITFLKKRLEMYYEAEEKILQGQSYTIGSRTLTRTSLANVQSKIKELESEISALETRGNSKRRSVRVVPLG